MTATTKMPESDTFTAASGQPVAAVARPVGRPALPVDLEAVRRLAGLGLGLGDIGPRLGMSRRSFFSKMSENPEIREAYDEGLAESIEFSATKLREHIEAGTLTAILFHLRTRAGWKISGDVNVNVQPLGGQPTIDGHVLDLAARHSLLLDSPDPDAIDAEWSEVVDEPCAAAAAAQPTPAELKEMMK